jgi:hypothetical protein
LFEVGLGSGLARRSLGFVGASLDIHLPLGSLPTRNLLDGLVIVAVTAGTFYIQSFKRVLLPDMFEAFEISCLQPLFGIKAGAPYSSSVRQDQLSTRSHEQEVAIGACAF